MQRKPEVRFRSPPAPGALHCDLCSAHSRITRTKERNGTKDGRIMSVR